jgi:hypothetical protein
MNEGVPGEFYVGGLFRGKTDDNFPNEDDIFTVWPPLFANDLSMNVKIPAGVFLREIERRLSLVWGWG